MALRPPDIDIPDGSVLACYGRGVVSMIIRWWTGLLNFRSCPSHVAIICRHEGVVLAWESTTLSDVPDFIDGECRDGVQAHLLTTFVAEYPGKVYCWPLEPPCEASEVAPMLTYLQARHAEKTPYDKEQAIDSASPDHAEPDDSKLFCSELVTRALQMAGRVSENTNSSEMTPCDVVGWPVFGKRRRMP